MNEISINRMRIIFASIRRGGNNIQDYLHESTTPITVEDVDLFGSPTKSLDVKCESFKHFVELFNNQIVEGQDLRPNFLRSINRRVHGNADGIKVFFRDSNGTRQYMFVRFNYHYERDCWFD